MAEVAGPKKSASANVVDAFQATACEASTARARGQSADLGQAVRRPNRRAGWWKPPRPDLVRAPAERPGLLDRHRGAQRISSDPSRVPRPTATITDDDPAGRGIPARPQTILARHERSIRGTLARRHLRTARVRHSGRATLDTSGRATLNTDTSGHATRTRRGENERARSVGEWLGWPWFLWESRAPQNRRP
jgi:hypothetical protein